MVKKENKRPNRLSSSFRDALDRNPVIQELRGIPKTHRPFLYYCLAVCAFLTVDRTFDLGIEDEANRHLNDIAYELFGRERDSKYIADDSIELIDPNRQQEEVITETPPPTPTPPQPES